MLIAESNKTVEDCGVIYFPPSSVKFEYLVESDFRSSCLFKNTATYYHIKVGEKEFKNAVWSYKDPDPEVDKIKGCLAFADELLEP
ncbi:DUF427 domain-containing protein [Flammeovirga aprica]|uniref:DUF427 domain-containing protein n=1 Tax=Flammeovirga aprica JL-4 TaxID=694437 RepID=A0A7X9RW77_9BACT|nr:DUF427 domain-containing protein [Flammeovirga aprica]NME69855.1 DUF427 domain-containing protein [Flammeovirga aprica JL-4]